MAQQVNITHVSDLCGEVIQHAEPALTFGWDGSEYTISLTAKEADKFRKAVEP